MSYNTAYKVKQKTRRKKRRKTLKFIDKMNKIKDKKEAIAKKAIKKAVGNGFGKFDDVYLVGRQYGKLIVRITNSTTNEMRVVSFCSVIFSHKFAKAFWQEEGLGWGARLQSLATAKNRTKYLQTFL